MERNIFIFDQNKCVGCHACVVACMNENGFQHPKQWRNVHKSNNNHFPQLPLFYLSLACNHCEDAPCLKNCPALAYSRDPKTGAIIHHPEKCIGCKYCTWACPFDAPKYNSLTRVVEKCTFCNHRIEEDLKPACTNLCPVGALNFVNIEFTRENSIKSSPVPVNVGSGIKIKKLRKNNGPEIDLYLFSGQPKQLKQKIKKKITAREEWPLLVFTLLSAFLVSIYSSGLTSGFVFKNKFIFMSLAFLAGILSLFHLGKKLRAWRSLINIKNSWLSREIGLFSLFFTGVFFDFFIYNIPNIILIVIGILFLFSIDMLYLLATWKWPAKIHSAHILFVAATIYLLLTNLFYLLIGILIIRLALFTYRKSKSEDPHYLTLSVRIITIVLLPLLILIKVPMLFIFITLIIGEIIDRIDFYNELDVPNPAIEITV